MPGRSYTAGTGYRYGFNGKEIDNEIKGNGNSLDFGARMYDTRLGRWTSPDPKEAKYPSYSTYESFFNSPMNIIDPSGKGGVLTEENDKNTHSTFLKVTSVIYIYSDVVKGAMMDAVRVKIQDDIKNQWNHPDGKAQGKVYYRGHEVPIVFDVNVKVVNRNDAAAIALKSKQDNDYSVNFLKITESEGSRIEPQNSVSINDGLFYNYGVLNFDQLFSNGSTEAPHEYGHFLNYFIISTDNNLNPSNAGHALQNEQTYIMYGEPSASDPCVAE